MLNLKGLRRKPQSCDKKACLHLRPARDCLLDDLLLVLSLPGDGKLDERAGALESRDALVGNGEVQSEWTLDGDLEIAEVLIFENLTGTDALRLVAFEVDVGLNLAHGHADLVLEAAIGLG